MDVAKLTANLSYARRLQVGAIIVKDNRIISIGYNGTPAGWDNICEHEVGGKLTTKDEVIHAEENAILKLARDGESGKDSTMYITHAPCINCARLIYNAGITSIYYEVPYRDTSGIDFLQKCGISVQKLGDNEVKSEQKVVKVLPKLTRERFGKLLKVNNLWMKSKNGNTVNLVTSEYDWVSVIEFDSVKHESPIFDTKEELFAWIVDILYNEYEIGNIFAEEK
jgi:dCMP deaminase